VVDTQIPAALLRTRDQREATEDHLLRRFVAALDRANPPRTGSGRSGAIDCLRPGPEVVERSAVRIARDGRCTVRFTVGLPARGRRILGSAAARLLTEDVPALLRAVQVGDDPALAAHITSVCAQRALRRALPTHGLVAFIADGSILPRVDGVRQQPLPDAIPFESPPSLRVTLPTPTGPVTGLGLPMGVTVLTGGGFHGKSTVLHALQRGHLDHVPGDGREGVVTRSDAVKIRAEDGRAVTGVDIGDFLSTLPGGRSTRPFSTVDASGSTSQAAALVEAIEAGARVLLIDEDTSATNLLVRDPRMSALIDRDPITPLIRRVRQLADQGIGTVIVVGGVADWLGVADHVVAMVDWRPVDVTDRAHALVPERPSPPGPLGTIAPRRPRGRAVDRVRCRDRRVDLDRDPIDLGLVEQVLGSHEAATVGHAVAFLLARANGGRSIRALLDALDAILDDEGIEAVSPWGSPGGTLIRPRRFEIASALNRLRSLHLVDD
jgi:predicted ABC-class ATPase